MIEKLAENHTALFRFKKWTFKQTEQEHKAQDGCQYQNIAENELWNQWCNFSGQERQRDIVCLRDRLPPGKGLHYGEYGMEIRFITSGNWIFIWIIDLTTKQRNIHVVARQLKVWFK